MTNIADTWAAADRDVLLPTLKIVTAGSIDDGKSTLIGRLLYDTGSIADDQLDALAAVSRRTGRADVDLSFLTDGLKAEREQGITIDVAYRYARTANRPLVLIDAPGHARYTRNMVTGASNADVALILVDARVGIVEQTRRHTMIAALLGIPHVVLCANKMDAVEYGEDAFRAVERAFTELAREAGIARPVCIPISALRGDNVVTRSVLMPWYAGPSLVEYLESANPATAPEDEAGIFAVQWALRAPRADPAYRGYAGRMVGGRLNAGDRVIVLPSREHARIAAIELGGGPLHAASAPRSVTLRLDGDVDVARGDIIAAIDADLRVTGAVDARICWMGERPLETGNRYLLRSLGFTTPCIVSAIAHRLDIETGARADARGRLERNDIGHLSLRLAAPIACQEYSRNRHTGSFILVDEVENTTVAAGMIVA